MSETDSALTWRALKWLGLSLAALVGMAQVGVIVQEAIPTGAISVTTLYGAGQVVSSWSGTSDALNAWVVASSQFGSIWLWLYLHLGFDLLFIAGYALLGRVLVPKEKDPLTWHMLTVLIAADIAEDVLAALAFGWTWAQHSAALAVVVPLHLATMAKWLAAGAFLVRLAFSAWDHARPAIWRMLSALWEQRFSVVVVLFLAVLAAGRGPDVLEQMPDVQRSWLTAPGMGWFHAAVAVIAQLLLAALLLFLGRMRTWRAREKASGEDRRENPSYWPWLAAPAGLTLLALVLWGINKAEIERWRLGVAIAVPVLVAAGSRAIVLFYRRRPRDRQAAEPRPESAGEAGQPREAAEEVGESRAAVSEVCPPAAPGPPPLAPETRRRVGLFPRRPEAKPVQKHTELDDDGVPVLGHRLDGKHPDVSSVRTAGDALAVAVVAVTGLGLVRSFTALAILYEGGYTVAAAAAVVFGIAITTFVWPLANRPVRDRLRKWAGSGGPVAQFADWARRGRTGKVNDQESDANVTWWPWLAAGAPFLIADAGLVFVPLWTTHWLGVLGTTVIGAGTLAVVLALLAYLAQTQRPLPLFRLIRLNVTPVITLVAVIGLAGAIAGSSPVVHLIRGPVPAASPPDQTNLLDALDAWLRSPDDTCSVPSPAAGAAGTTGPARVRPLILVAAAGGGIRAAWWTEQALAKLAGTTCGRTDVFAVSSVSGSSVGMAVLDSTRSVTPANAVKAANADMADIAGPDALAAGIDGLLLHDMIAGFTGLDLPAAQMPPGQPFGDRAGLIESAWQREDGGLTEPFPLRRAPLPWRLLFNSTDADSGCRAIIADRPLWSPADRPAGNGITCDLRSAVPGGGSFSFLAELPCMNNIALVTAAMLSARFPFITPSGVVTSCTAKGALAGQFVDGGYADSSGLLTLADLIPSLTAKVRAHNAAVMAQAGPGQPVTLVVPIVMYLGNSPRPVPVDPSASLIQEPFVPLDGQSAAGAELAVSDTLLQRIQGMLGASQWLPCAGCGAVESAVARIVHYQVIFVSPRTEPRISAPLGWVLSAASRAALNKALGNEEQPASRCWQDRQPVVCQPGVGRMADLLLLIQGG
jgi:hypothetical protein